MASLHSLSMNLFDSSSLSSPPPDSTDKNNKNDKGNNDSTFDFMQLFGGNNGGKDEVTNHSHQRPYLHRTEQTSDSIAENHSVETNVYNGEHDMEFRQDMHHNKEGERDDDDDDGDYQTNRIQNNSLSILNNVSDDFTNNLFDTNRSPRCDEDDHLIKHDENYHQEMDRHDQMESYGQDHFPERNNIDSSTDSNSNPQQQCSFYPSDNRNIYSKETSEKTQEQTHDDTNEIDLEQQQKQDQEDMDYDYDHDQDDEFKINDKYLSYQQGGDDSSKNGDLGDTVALSVLNVESSDASRHHGDHAPSFNHSIDNTSDVKNNDSYSYTHMMSTVEEFLEELHMMQVKNAILMDRMTMAGANV